MPSKQGEHIHPGMERRQRQQRIGIGRQCSPDRIRQRVERPRNNAERIHFERHFRECVPECQFNPAEADIGINRFRGDFFNHRGQTPRGQTPDQEATYKNKNGKDRCHGNARPFQYPAPQGALLRGSL